MKKMLLSVLAMAALSITPAMAWEVAITKQQLPAEAQAFLSKNFAKNEVVVATHDKDIVNRMHKRVIAVGGGSIIRDDERGGYSDHEKF